MKLFQPQAIPPVYSIISRASSGTYVDVDGVLRTQATDADRVQDGVYLIEPASTNVCLQSQDLSASPWAGNAAVTATADLYRGYAPFWEITKTSQSSWDRNQFLGAVAAGQQRTLTVALLAGTTTTCDVGLNAADGWGAPADVQSQVLEGPGLVAASPFGPSLLRVSGLSATVPTLVRLTRTFAAAGAFGVYLFPDTASSAVTGGSVKATRVQVEPGAAATSYIPTTTAAATRAADILTTQPADLTGGSGAAGGHIVVNATDYYGVWITNAGYVSGNRITYRGSLYQLAPDVTYNTGDEPGVSPKWLRVGPTNRQAMLDGEVDSKSYDNPLPNLRGPQVGILCSTQGPIDSVLVAALEGATHLTVVVSASLYGPEIFRQTVTLEPGASALRSQYLFTGFAAAAGAVVQIGAWRYPYSPTQFPGIGLIAWGQAENLGCTEWGARAGIKDYSRKEPDQFGQVIFVRRAFSKTVSATVELDNADINRVQDRLASLRATPAVWIFSEDPAYSVPLVVYGFYKDFYATFPRLNSTQCALEIEGLT